MNKISKKIMISFYIFCFILIQLVMPFTSFAVESQSERLAGTNRYKTAVEISKKGWATGSEFVILARGDDFADALCAGPLAKKHNAPILLTSSTEMDADTLAEIQRLGAKNIYIIGGVGAISQKIETVLRESGFGSIERIWGSDRYETSVKIAEKLGTITNIVLATGANFPDALSISAIASSKGMPIILTQQGRLPEKVKQYISGKAITKTYIIGGTGVIGDAVRNSVPSPVRLGGSDRFETNALVLTEFAKDIDFTNLYVAVGDGPSGDEFADALSGAVLAAKTSSPVLLSYKTLPGSIGDFIKTKASSKSKVIALGGIAVVPASVVDSLLSYVNNATAPVNPPVGGAPAGGGGGGAPGGGGNQTPSTVSVQKVEIVTYVKSQPNHLVVRTDLPNTLNGNAVEIDMSALGAYTQFYGFQITVNQACKFEISAVDNPFIEDYLDDDYTGQNLVAGVPGNNNIVKIDDIIWGTSGNDGVSLKSLRERGATVAIFNCKLSKDGNEVPINISIKIVDTEE